MEKYEPMPLDKEAEISKNSGSFIRKEYTFYGNKLICVGSHHTSDFNNSQFDEIKKIVENRDISFIVIEMSKRNLDKSKKSNKELNDEREFLIKIAKEKDIEVVPGDLDIEKLFLEKAREHNKEEIVLLRALMYLNSHKENIFGGVEKVFRIMHEKGGYKDMIEGIRKEKGFGLEEFKEKIKDIVRKSNNKELGDLTPEDNILPSPLGKKTRLNDIMREISYKRDEHMIKKILEYMKKGNVLYVAGKNHVIRQEPFLRDLEKQG